VTTPAFLVDCDTGIDDALALLYLARLVRDGEAELAAIGTVHGNTAPQVAASNTLRVLERAGISGVPVAVGAARPLAQPVRLAGDIHGADGMGDVGLPEPRGGVADVSAAEQIVALARRRPGELTLLAVGPLTNLAIALLLDPALPERFRQVVIMGGALDHPGNITPHAEANIWHDPEAAELVLAAPWPVTLVPLDATHPTAVNGAWLDRLAASGAASAQLASAILDFYVGAYQPILGDRGAVIHDALAAMLAVDPSLGEYVERPVHVELRGERVRGATLWDRRAVSSPAGDASGPPGPPMPLTRRKGPDEDPRPRVKVAVRADVATFKDRLLASLV
jgi:purine nucleosidase